VHDPDGASWEVYTVLADAPSDTSLGGSSRRHRLHQPRRAPDVELTTHGVPDAGPAATREQTPAAASVCCDTGTARPAATLRRSRRAARTPPRTGGGVMTPSAVIGTQTLMRDRLRL